MSDLAAAAEKLNVPEDILQRSAAARADAAGSSTDDVLAAWAGGAAAPTATPPDPASTGDEKQAEPADEPDGPARSEEEDEVSTPAPQVSVPEPALEQAVAAVVEPELDPVPIRRRIRLAGRSGAVVGAFLALMGWVFSAQFFLQQATVFGEAEAETIGIEAATGRVVLGAILVSAAIGVLVAGVVRGVPSMMSRAMTLRTPALASGMVGAVVGTLVGALIGALLVGMGTPVETAEGVSNLPIVPSVIWSMLLWAGGGWLVGAAVQGLSVPETLAVVEADEVTVVSRRLGSAFGLPVASGLAILVLVLSMAYAFISFPAFAPLTGTIAAASVLAFAAISASKPSMRVERRDVIVAVLGLASVLVLVVSLLTFLVPQEEHAEGEEGAAAVEGVTETSTSSG